MSSASFPSVAAEKHDWPWQTYEKVLPNLMPNGSPWPKITIVTPNYNYGHFLEETIRSVLLQGYPNLEYIIMDGKSTDNSVDVIKKYESYISYWESEKDHGQAHAINKGFQKATGEIVAWINSDDLYAPKALSSVAERYMRSCNKIILGDVEDFFDESDKTPIRKRMHHVTIRSLLKPMNNGYCWHQPGTFVPMSVMKKVALLNESLHFTFDKDWMFRLLSVASVDYLEVAVAQFRIHPDAKTREKLDEAMQEEVLVNTHYMGAIPENEARDLISQCHFRLVGLYLCEHKDYEPFFNRTKALREIFKSGKAIWSSKGVRLVARVLLPKILWMSK